MQTTSQPTTRTIPPPVAVHFVVWAFRDRRACYFAPAGFATHDRRNAYRFTSYDAAIATARREQASIGIASVTEV